MNDPRDSGTSETYDPTTGLPILLNAQDNDGNGGQAISSAVGYYTPGLPNPLGPGISVSTAALDSGRAALQASAALTYSFEVTGGSTQSMVSVQAFGLLSAGQVNNGDGNAYLTITSGGLYYLQYFCQDSGTEVCNFAPTGADGRFEQLLSIPVGTEVSVELIASASSDGSQLPGQFKGDSSGYANVDPSFFIDPSTPNADQYTITFSQGITNGFPQTVATPEPGSLSLLGLGAFGLATLRRRMQTKDTSAA